MKSTIAVTILLMLGCPTWAQNNPIFYGGSGDGWTQSGYVGAGTDTIMFRGAGGDGHASGMYVQPAVLISKGGAGDGHMFAAGQVPDIDQFFYGGMADGSNYSSSTDPEVDKIFFGGEGDGWASQYLPLSPLPLNLLSFKGYADEQQHYLEWTTALEINTAYFDVQRSANGAGYVSLGTLPAAGNSTEPQHYKYLDNKPLPGNNFYRLRMVDADGTTSYSSVVLLHKNEHAAALWIYPNPAATVLNIQLSEMPHHEVQMEVLDTRARLVLQHTAKNHEALMSLDISRLTPGIYYLRITSGTRSHNLRFVRQ